MTTTSTLTELATWMDAQEGSRFEFKEAKNHYDFEELVKYCCALANEGGGKVILGVTDKKPRRVVGTTYFAPPQRTEHGINERLRVIKVEAEEIAHPNGRVLVFHVPSRPQGYPISYKGAFWMRSGDALVPMTADFLQRIFAEVVQDFSAQPCPGAQLSDLDPAAIEEFRRLWIKKSRSTALASLTSDQLLTDAELIAGDHVTYAALVLFGTHAALGRYLGQAEVIYEYRSSEASLPAQQREEFRRGFFTFYNRLWELVDLRNDKQKYRLGMIVLDVPTFEERSFREALLNAVSHRDYRLSGSAFIRQYPRQLQIVSPGAFPTGITPANILDRQNPRNRRIAEAFAKCGLVERSGQGANLMFEEAVRNSQPLPDYAGSDDYQVALTLRGEVQNPSFVAFLEKVGDEKLKGFTTADFLALDAIQREQPIPEGLKLRLPRLIDLGIVERVGRGRGVRYILSRGLYAHIGQRGTYTRKRGLDHETKKELLLTHLRQAGPTGSPIAELVQVLPDIPRRSTQTLLQELRREGRTVLTGSRRGARWTIASTPGDMNGTPEK